MDNVIVVFGIVMLIAVLTLTALDCAGGGKFASDARCQTVCWSVPANVVECSADEAICRNEDEVVVLPIPQPPEDTP